MTDFHTHILPSIDDGSTDVTMTIEMLKAEAEQHVERVVFTPHFYADRDTPESFLKRRDEAFEKLQHALRMQGRGSEDCDEAIADSSQKETISSLPEIKLGAEVYYFPGMSKSEKLRELCMEDSNVLLLELPFRQWTKDVYSEVKNIIEEQKLTVILAHVERYYSLQKDKKIWNSIMELPVIPQINTGSLTKLLNRWFIYRFIGQGHNIILGTDAHNTTTRVVNMRVGREKLRNKFGDDFLTEIDTLGNRIWNGRESKEI